MPGTPHRQEKQKVPGYETLEVYTRDDVASGIWQARIRHPAAKGYLTHSLKTADYKEAVTKAIRWYHQIEGKIATGAPLKPNKLVTVAGQYYSWLENQSRATGKPAAKQVEEYKKLSKRYIESHFGKRDIGTIKQADIEALKVYVRDYWTNGPGSRLEDTEKHPSPHRVGKTNSTDTIGKVLVVLRGIFNFAVREQAITESLMPQITQKTSKKPKGTNYFSRDEWKIVYTAIRKWIRESKDEREKDRRQLLRDYIIFLANTGIRPGTESHAILWSNVVINNPNASGHTTVFVPSGKTGERFVVPMTNVIKPINRIAARRKKATGSYPSPNEPLFALSNGKVLSEPYLGRLFLEFLKYAGLVNQGQGRRTLYSLRHTYATFRLTMSNRLSPHDLALNMGTSEDMILKHYSHVCPKDLAEKLTSISSI